MCSVYFYIIYIFHFVLHGMCCILETILLYIIQYTYSLKNATHTMKYKNGKLNINSANNTIA